MANATPTTKSKPQRIDTHSHFLPEFYRTALKEAGHDGPDGMPTIPKWSCSEHLNFMSTSGISKSYISISSPGVHFGSDASARELAMRVNDAAAELAREHPEKFGWFASLPLPNVDDSLKEIERVFDNGKTKPDGVILLTNYRGIYAGDSRFDRMFQELDRRHIKVFFHPTSAFCPYFIPSSSRTSNQGGSEGEGEETLARFQPLSYPNPMLEFMFDTARAFTQLLLSGTLTKYKNITYIIPHCGSVLPLLIDRIAEFSGLVSNSSDGGSATKKEIDRIFREQFYFDLAGMPMENQIPAILRLTGTERLLYGSDYPFTPKEIVQGMQKTMDTGAEKIWDNETTERAYRGNALRLFEEV